MKATEILGISREFYYRWLRKYELRWYVEEARIALRDKAIECVEKHVDTATDADLAIRYLNFTKNLSGGITVQGDNLKIVVASGKEKTELDEFLKK